MHFELNLDEKVISKIKKILESGEYENEKEVIIRAIDNLYERTISEFGVSSDSVVEFIPHKMSKPLERNLTVDASEKYGEEGRLTKRAEKYFEMGETYFDAGKHEQSLEFLEIASQAISDLFERYPPVKNTYWTNLLEKIRVLQSEMQIEEEDSVYWMRIKDYKNDIKELLSDKWQGPKHITECIAPSPEEIYGPTQVGLIWGFHNRFFPVKFIISVLASLILQAKDERKIIGTKHPWIEFETFNDKVKLEAINLVQTLNEMKEQNKFQYVDPTVGFLATSDKFLRTPRLKKTARRSKRLAEEKANELEETSKNRFLTQYVGRELSSKKGIRTVAGACFEMGLVKCGYDPNTDNKLYVTLTDIGEEFAVMDNPLVNTIQDHMLNVELSITTPSSDLAIKNIFSKEESKFILKNIISKYALEEKVVKEFLKRKERLSVAEITEIFSQIQNMFIEECFGPGGEKISFNFSKKFLDELGISDEMSAEEQQKEMRRIVKDLFDSKLPEEAMGRATAIIKKMHELGLVQREQEGLKVFYTVISS